MPAGKGISGIQAYQGPRYKKVLEYLGPVCTRDLAIPEPRVYLGYRAGPKPLLF